ncbi:MAG TPA: CHAD domain-containing protein [Candidatus Acidoferrum sp.]|nr:CHAD domain-containing protein [Candidatus Acidoferrum sp.]
MALAVPIPSRITVERRGLAFWMERVLVELAALRSKTDADTVHDLRVALRRCRSVATAIREVDPHPDWDDMRNGARKLFQSLGELRDAQIQREWIERVHGEPDVLKTVLLETLDSTEGSARKNALHSAARFEVTQWRALMCSLPRRLRLIAEDGDAARCLALERLEDAQELHRRAMRTESPGPWHTLRIGVKRFRYTVESLAPALHARWADSLKDVQDVLGDIHDLDVLQELVKSKTAKAAGLPGSEWESRIAKIRQEKMRDYRQRSLGNNGVWQSWKRSFPRADWENYGKGRITATRKAADGKLRKSLALQRIAKRLWTQLRACRAAEIFSNAKERQTLETAAQLSGIRPGTSKGSRSGVKAARNFLLKSPVPPAWSFAEWECVAWAVRFQRGAEPESKHKRFGKLPVEQQARIILHAGVLRLAAALYASGITSGGTLRVENLSEGLLLVAGGAEDTPENAAEFSKAKRLLERSLGKSIVIQALAEQKTAAARTQTDGAVKAPAIEIVR